MYFKVIYIYVMGVQPFDGKGPHPLSWAGSQVTLRKITINGIPKYLNYCVIFIVCTLDAGLLARSQYSEGPATGHLDTGFSWFPCVYKQMLKWFPRFQVATTCF